MRGRCVCEGLCAGDRSAPSLHATATFACRCFAKTRSASAAHSCRVRAGSLRVGSSAPMRTRDLVSS